MTAIVELKDATVKVNNGFDTEKTILDHVNLTIREGDFITILGGNGAGKSTLFNVIAGTLMLTSGQISSWVRMLRLSLLRSVPSTSHESSKILNGDSSSYDCCRKPLDCQIPW